MRQSRSTAEEIIRIIAESELPTASIGGTARKSGIKEATLYRYRARYKGMGVWGIAARFTLTQSSHKMSLTSGGFSLAALS